MKTEDGSVSRRRVLKGLGASALTLGAVASGPPAWSIIRSRAQLALDGPDVYVVVLDDCSLDYIGYYQSILSTAYQGPIHTPELDALLAASWTSSSMRATIPVCASSRSSLLTGSTGAQTGVPGYPTIFVQPMINQFLARIQAGQLVSLPSFLTSQGLDTSARGKVDHTGQLMSKPGQVSSVGTYTSIASLSADPAYAPDGIGGVDGTFMIIATLPDEVPHADELRTDEQIARISSPYNGQRADFLGLVLPHTPRSVHQQWLDLYDPADVQTRSTLEEVVADLDDIPAAHRDYLENPRISGVPKGEVLYTQRTEEQRRAHVRHMLACVSHASYQIGRMMNALDAAGRPFVLVLTSDQGYHLGEKGHWEKGTLYDKSLLVPMGIYSSEPNSSYPVGNDTRPLSLLGLARTVAQLAGIDDSSVPEIWGGPRFDDLTPVCTEHTWGPSATQQSRALVWQTTNAFKLIVHYDDSTELYNLTADPGEIDNLLVPNPPAGQAIADGPTRAAWVSEAHAELDVRARQLRAADWKARRRAEVRSGGR